MNRRFIRPKAAYTLGLAYIAGQLRKMQIFEELRKNFAAKTIAMGEVSDKSLRQNGNFIDVPTNSKKKLEQERVCE